MGSSIDISIDINCMMCLANLALGVPYREDRSYTQDGIIHSVSLGRRSGSRVQHEVALTCTLKFCTDGYWLTIDAKWVLINNYER